MPCIVVRFLLTRNVRARLAVRIQISITRCSDSAEESERKRLIFREVAGSCETLALGLLMPIYSIATFSERIGHCATTTVPLATRCTDNVLNSKLKHGPHSFAFTRDKTAILLMYM